METNPVLIIQHQTFDGPGYLAQWLAGRSIPYVLFNAEVDGGFPWSMETYSALAVMGGAMSVNDHLISNRQAEILILQAFLQDKPVVGHCLGGQLMARALGGVVTRNHVPEIGWCGVQYNDHPLSEEWFGSNPTPVAMQWHYETFSIPTGATPLATSVDCQHQAFAWGKHIAMQFHIEVDSPKVVDWVTIPDPDWNNIQGQYQTVQDKQQILQGIVDYLPLHQATASHIYRKWLSTTGWADKLF